MRYLKLSHLTLLSLPVARIFALLCTLVCSSNALAQILVNDGVADLRSWTPKSGSILELRGTWEFVPGALVNSPMGTPVANSKLAPLFTQVPRGWNNIIFGGKNFGSFGAATYRVKLLLPPRSADAPPLALDIREVYTAGRVFMNGRLALASGQPALDAASERPKASRMIVALPPVDEVEIAVQVSNFLHYEGGMSYMPCLGLLGDLVDNDQDELWVNLSVIGALAGLSLFFLVAYAAGRRDIGGLLFGLTNVLAIVRIVAARRLIYAVFPDFPHATLIAIEYVDLFLLIASGLFLWQWLFPKESFRQVVYFTCGLSGLAILAAILLPVYWLTYIRDPLSIYVAIVTLYGFSISTRAWLNNRLGSTPMMVSSLVALVLFMHDILANMKIIVGSDVGAFAFVAFALGNATVLGLRAEHALSREEGMARAMASLNQSLEIQVAERTRHLEREIERRTEAEQESERASAAKSEFLATMSHEIRTPLNGVIGIAQLLQDDVQDPELKSRVSALVNTGELLQSIVSDILDFSKIEAGQFEINPRPASIASAVRDVGSLFKSQAFAKGLSFSVLLDPGLPEYAMIDGNRLRQILANIVGNAIKFTNTGQVSVRAGGENGRLRIEVIDTGVGIAQEILSDLFKPFMQVRTSLADGQRGTGLGLSIASRLVQLMGGSIKVDSTLGNGSSFLVDLPLVPAEEAQSSPSQLPQHPAVRRMKVLVADDGEVNRIVLGEFIRREGHDVHMASNGIQAFENAERELFDLVFMDIAMPEMDGFESARAIRRLPPPNGQVIIIAATATTQETFRQQCLSAGMNGFIPKPIRRHDLMQILENVAAGTQPDSGLAPPQG